MSEPSTKPSILYEKTMKIWRKVEIKGSESCWPWLGARTEKGYGSYKDRRGRFLRSHRIVYELYYGEKIPDGLNVCHRCDNPICCNSKHLFLGTQKENIRDASSKGRLGKERL
jgi:hypothetical protein